MINVQQLLHVFEGLCCPVQTNRTKLVSLEARQVPEPLKASCFQVHQAVLDNQQMSGCAMDA